MDRVRVLIAEDEPLGRKLLTDLLASRADVEIVAAVENGLLAWKACESHKPDIAFLDVQMPKLDGLEVAGLLRGTVQVVFVTAYDEYAVAAFETAAVDYVLKPYAPERLYQALERAKARAGAARIESATSEEPIVIPGRRIDRVAVKEGSQIAVIPVVELVWARSEDDYVRLSAHGREWLKHQSLQSLEESLDPECFVRIHRTCLVNVTKVSSIEAETRDRFWVLLADGSSLPASRQGEKRLRQVLGL